MIAGLAVGKVKLVKGQTGLCPQLFKYRQRIYRVVLRANLIIHNTDPNHPITIVKIDHYDTNGKLVEHYLSSRWRTLVLLAATRFTIKKLSNSGHNHFIAEWQAQNLVTELSIIESVIDGSLGTQGIRSLLRAESFRRIRTGELVDLGRSFLIRAENKP